MKKLIALCMLVSMSSIAQVKGNKKIETRSFKIENVEIIKVNLYANITIDQSEKEGMTITMDANLFDKINTSVANKMLHLDQLKWVQPSQEIIIKIGAPNLKTIEKGTHRTLRVINVDNDYLNVDASVGKVLIDGKTKQLNIGIKNGTVDASKLIAKNAKVTIENWGKAKIYAENEVYSSLTEDARLEIVNTPQKMSGDTERALARVKNKDYNDVKWINFKIKNNSWNRHQFMVVGPKKDGSKFSYGFPMMPGRVKKERWSTGTKVYKVSKIGLKTLLVTIKAEDEGKTVKLFEKG